VACGGPPGRLRFKAQHSLDSLGPCAHGGRRRWPAFTAWSRTMPREKIILGCTECKNRNYFTMKNKRLHPERVEWKKYCPRCDKHQLHKETK
jgi:large subunit ribosomal protein L33